MGLFKTLINRPGRKRGDGEEIREYVHAEDAARLSIKALDSKFVNQSNIGLKKINLIVFHVFCSSRSCVPV